MSTDVSNYLHKEFSLKEQNEFLYLLRKNILDKRSSIMLDLEAQLKELHESCEKIISVQ